MDPTSTSSLAFAKTLGSQPVIAALSALLGYIILKPKTVGEAIARGLFAALASIFLGPLAVAVAHAKWPELFDSAVYLDTVNQTGLGILYVTAPIQILAGLPAWWVLGAFLRWFDRRSNKDIGELFKDLKEFLPHRKGDQ